MDWHNESTQINSQQSAVQGLIRDVTAGATGATAVAPKFSDTLTLFQPRGQILPTITEIAAIIFPWLRPWTLSLWQKSP